MGWSHTVNLVWIEKAQNWFCICGLADWIFHISGQVVKYDLFKFQFNTVPWAEVAPSWSHF